jgi:hypothetical protein
MAGEKMKAPIAFLTDSSFNIAGICGLLYDVS